MMIFEKHFNNILRPQQEEIEMKERIDNHEHQTMQERLNELAMAS